MCRSAGTTDTGCLAACRARLCRTRSPCQLERSEFRPPAAGSPSCTRRRSSTRSRECVPDGRSSGGFATFAWVPCNAHGVGLQASAQQKTADTGSFGIGGRMSLARGAAVRGKKESSAPASGCSISRPRPPCPARAAMRAGHRCARWCPDSPRCNRAGPPGLCTATRLP